MFSLQKVSNMQLYLKAMKYWFFFCIYWSSYLSPTTTSRIQQTSHQHVFIKDEFHFLDVPGVGRYSALDIYDCIFKCLLNPQCNSVNMAAETDAVRKLWCELLPSDIYKNSKDYNKNMSSHHFSMQVSASFYGAFSSKTFWGYVVVFFHILPF